MDVYACQAARHKAEKKKSIRLLRAFNIGRTPLCLAAHLAGLCLSLECIPKQETRGSLLKKEDLWGKTHIDKKSKIKAIVF